MKKETVCNIPEPRNVFFPTKRTYYHHKLLCTTLNGKITVINSSALQDSMIEEFKKKITSLSAIERGKYQYSCLFSNDSFANTEIKKFHCHKHLVKN